MGADCVDITLIVIFMAFLIVSENEKPVFLMRKCSTQRKNNEST